jgi:hypothetical protein
MGVQSMIISLERAGHTRPAPTGERRNEMVPYEKMLFLKAFNSAIVACWV